MEVALSVSANPRWKDQNLLHSPTVRDGVEKDAAHGVTLKLTAVTQ